MMYFKQSCLFQILVIIKLVYASSHSKPKNVLFIIADDLGWADLGYANPNIHTPNIDRLAKNGIILNQAYTYSLCSPSRNSIMTGLFAEHTGLQHHVIKLDQPTGVPLSYRMLPQYFKDFGYQTHIVGKWHLGYCNLSYTPAHRGFDSFYGFFNGQSNYMTHRLKSKFRVKTLEGIDFFNQTNEYLEPVLDQNNTHSCYAFTDRIISLIEKQNKNRPFLIVFSAQNVHTPLQVPDKYVNAHKYVTNENRRRYLGLVTMLDEAIRNVTQKLADLGYLDDTLIAFTSDNGGGAFELGENFPLRGAKSTVFEGGQRVRAFINGFGLKPNIYDGMFHSIDWLPTLLNAAIGVPIEIKNIDGINQWPSIINNRPSARTQFIYNIDPLGAFGCEGPTEAIRSGDWKLINGCPGFFRSWYTQPTYVDKFISSFYQLANITKKMSSKFDNVSYLFNLKDDPFEKVNLASKFPDKLNEMNDLLAEYKKKTVQPFFPPSDPKADPENWGDKYFPGWC